MTKESTRNLTLFAILGTWALILRFLDFPIFPPAAFLKFDFSDLIALIGLIIGGPKGLVLVALIRDSVNYLIKGGQMGIPIGALMSFLGTLSLGLPVHYGLKKYKISLSKGRLLQAMALATLSLVLCMGILNYFIALPFYVRVMNFPIDNYLFYVLTLVTPFNLIKGLILSLSVWLTYDQVRILLSKRALIYSQYDD